jgi:uncharacterized protein
MDWYNEPPKWAVDENTITIHTGPDTDFWRITHYDFIRDTGHFYYQRQSGDFLAEVKITGAYAVLYDQAGLMVRVDEKNWVKCGIEYVDGVQQASAVVTREFSDWSILPLAHNPASFWLRLKRQGAALEIQYAGDGEHYQMLRLAYLLPVETVDVGLMCASPQGPGFSVTFENLTIQPI